MSEIKVSTSELAHVAGSMLPGSQQLESAGSTLNGSVGISVGLPELDGTLQELGTALSQWLDTAGKRINTLAYNTQAAADVYSLVEANNAESAQPAPNPSNVA
jgi:hypothetical protein